MFRVRILAASIVLFVVVAFGLVIFSGSAPIRPEERSLMDTPGGWEKIDAGDCLVFKNNMAILQQHPLFGPIKRYNVGIIGDSLFFPQTEGRQRYHRATEYDSFVSHEVPVLFIYDDGPIPQGKYRNSLSAHCRKETFQ